MRPPKNCGSCLFGNLYPEDSTIWRHQRHMPAWILFNGFLRISRCIRKDHGSEHKIPMYTESYPPTTPYNPYGTLDLKRKLKQPRHRDSRKTGVILPESQMWSPRNTNSKQKGFGAWRPPIFQTRPQPQTLHSLVFKCISLLRLKHQ